MLLVNDSRYEKLLCGSKYLALFMHSVHFRVDEGIITSSGDLLVIILSYSYGGKASVSFQIRVEILTRNLSERTQNIPVIQCRHY